MMNIEYDIPRVRRMIYFTDAELDALILASQLDMRLLQDEVRWIVRGHLVARGLLDRHKEEGD